MSSYYVGIIALVFHTVVTTLGVAMLTFPFFGKAFPSDTFLKLLIVDVLFISFHLTYRFVTHTPYRSTQGWQLAVWHGILSLASLIGAALLWWLLRTGEQYPILMMLLITTWVAALVTGWVFWYRKNHTTYTQG